MPGDRGVVRHGGVRGTGWFGTTGLLAIVVALVFSTFGVTIVRAAAAKNPPVWSASPSPSPPAPPNAGDLFGVACPTTSDCFIGGDYPSSLSSGADDLPLVGRSNGVTSSLAPAPVPPSGPGASGKLLGVACPTSTRCFAVGIYFDALSDEKVLIERWDGVKWNVVVSPSLPGDPVSSQLSSISCPTTMSCFAVGSVSDFDTPRKLIERWNGSTWSVVTDPTILGATRSELSAVSCAAATSCLAVGSSVVGALTQTLVERWDGAVWSVVTSPNPTGYATSTLAGVSCSTTTRCFAVGSSLSSTSGFPTSDTLVEVWDGSAVSIVATPDPTMGDFERRSQLTAIGCPSINNCFALGRFSDTETNGQSLTEQWDGTTWSMISPEVSPPAAAISCATATNCVAVGRGAIVKWSGSAWADVSGGGSQSELNRVSCISATRCFAVGEWSSTVPYLTNQSLIEWWNGSSWRIVDSPEPTGATFVQLKGITCATATECFAVGDAVITGRARALIEEWDGTRWSIVASSAATELTGVDCPSRTSCFAVGSPSGSSTRGVLVEHWNGTTWSLVRTAVASGVGDPSPQAISCASVTMCVAVGYLNSGSATVIVRYDGSTWSIVPSPRNGTKKVQGQLNDVSCPTVTSCFAVGIQTIGRRETTLVEHWNGVRWSIVSSPNVTGLTDNQLWGVACSTPTLCAAVGATDAAFPVPALIEQWDGTKWRLVRTPNRPLTDQSQLSGASCVQGPSCFAVGWYLTPIAQRTLVDRYQ